MARVANFSAGEIAGRKSPGGAVGRTPVDAKRDSESSQLPEFMLPPDPPSTTGGKIARIQKILPNRILTIGKKHRVHTDFFLFHFNFYFIDFASMMSY